MFNNYKILFFTVFSILSPLTVWAQDCDITIKGYVKDSGTGEALELVNIYIEETGNGAVSDRTGFFQLDNFCEGHYHLVMSHIGCQAKFFHIDIAQDTTLQLTMNHSGHELEGVIVTDKADSYSTQSTQLLNEQSIADNANDNLSNLLSSISGVTTLKNGNGISKPVVHGLYGNRLAILNNGIAQSGQQWGNDHSPEIDPLVANKIKVIKGVSTLKYPGTNLGSVILVEPRAIGRDPHLHGKAAYFFESNGRGHGLNLQLQRYHSGLAWRINGTLKKSGDKQTSSYFLNNSGHQEANLALQLEKSFSDKLFLEGYFSTFNTELGVLRGSHIGNLTDLAQAFNRAVPFFTEDEFSYQIDAPKQRVTHHLAKISSKYFFNNNQWLELTFATQLNDRKEFDIRRGDRSDIPAMSLQQYNYFTEGKFQTDFGNNWSGQIGMQSSITDNDNVAGTGILPLIPNYFSHETGLFIVLQKDMKASFMELGIRYDNIQQSVKAISNTIPREILRFKNIYHNWSSSLGWTYELNSQLDLSYNLGYATRSPAINELYSSGLHQGVSGIEEGSIDLVPEKSIKSTLSLSGQLSSNFSLETLIYYQLINDYIYLQPQDEFRLTIRGAFPVFKYEQTDAQIYGLDFSGQLQLTQRLGAKVTYSFIKGMDRSHDMPLINMPSSNITGSIAYTFSAASNIGKYQLENFELELENQYVFRQSNLLPGQDFVLPPNRYNLVAIKAATDIQLRQVRMRLYTNIDNLFNVAYRDYLNRQRYFADDLGINVTFGIQLKF